jgi:SAM-dependent methyltransferase
MGIHIPNLAFLLKFKGRCLGSTLSLGRQEIHISSDPLSQEYRDAMALLRKYDQSVSLDDLRGDGYANTLFNYLGSSDFCSIDASNYEGAELVHDLNLPVGADITNRFDCIFDGGTLEHVFDIPQALRNVGRMLKVGGLFLSSNGANNFLGHGFYQFSPELMWRALSLENGFQIELMQLVDESSTPKPENIEDPAVTGRRDERRKTSGCTLLQVAARKVRQVPDAAVNVQQSDYATAWES